MNCFTPQEMHVVHDFQHLVAAAILRYKPFIEMPPDTLKNRVMKSQCSDSMAKEVRLALPPLRIQLADSLFILGTKGEYSCKN